MGSEDEKGRGEYKIEIARKTTFAGSKQIQVQIVSQKDLMEKETSLFFPCIRVKRGFKLKVVTVLLCLAMFTERYTFFVSVYRTKYFGYILILFVIFLNMLL